jgi:hypothetical protein
VVSLYELCKIGSFKTDKVRQTQRGTRG